MGKFPAIPKPIKKLTDDFADFTQHITRRKCEHVRTTEPHALAMILDWDTMLTTLAERLLCSQCSSQGLCELTALKQKHPWGYRPKRQ